MFLRLCSLDSIRQSPWLLLWVLALALPSAVHSADGGSLNWGDKMLSERQHDFGSPAVGSEANHSIKISNIYRETVTISEVTSSSPDIRVRLEKTSLASKETAQLELTLEPSAFGRPSAANVTMRMTFDGVNFKAVTVPVMAFTKTQGGLPGGNWAEQMFSELKYDFGPVAMGAEAKHVIEITNLYKEDVTLSSPVTSCACITPQLDNFVLKSKQTARLVLNLDTINFKKKRDVTVTLSATFDQLNFKQIRIPITAYIRSDVVFSPGSVHFGVLSPGEGAERRVQVVYAGRNNWAVRSVRGGSSHLTADIKEVSRFNGRVEYELLVKLAGTAPVGRILDQLVLETDDALNPTIPIMVDGSIEADLQITPEIVSFGTLKPGVPKVVKVLVKGRKPFRVDKVECDSARDCFGVSLPSNLSTVQVISLTITPPDEPGEFKEAFTVTIAGRQATLAFKAIGTIEASTSKPPETEPASESKETVPPSAPETTTPP